MALQVPFGAIAQIPQTGQQTPIDAFKADQLQMRQQAAQEQQMAFQQQQMQHASQMQPLQLQAAQQQATLGEIEIATAMQTQRYKAGLRSDDKTVRASSLKGLMADMDPAEKTAYGKYAKELVGSNLLAVEGIEDAQERADYIMAKATDDITRVSMESYFGDDGYTNEELQADLQTQFPKRYTFKTDPKTQKMTRFDSLKGTHTVVEKGDPNLDKPNSQREIEALHAMPNETDEDKQKRHDYATKIGVIKDAPGPSWAITPDETSKTGFSWKDRNADNPNDASGWVKGAVPSGSSFDLVTDPDGNTTLSVREGPGVGGNLTTGARTAAGKSFSETLKLKNKYNMAKASSQVAIDNLTEFWSRYAGVGFSELMSKMGAEYNQELEDIRTGWADMQELYGSVLQSKGGKALTKAEREVFGASLPSFGDEVWTLKWNTKEAIGANMKRLEKIINNALVLDYMIATGERASVEDVHANYPTAREMKEAQTIMRYIDTLGLDEDSDPREIEAARVQAKAMLGSQD